MEIDTNDSDPWLNHLFALIVRFLLLLFACAVMRVRVRVRVRVR